MSSGCGDVLSIEDLKTAKKHQIFEAEVITGRAGGVAGGASIDYATNQVTGQTQKTLPAVLRDAGFTPVSWDFSTGGVLSSTDRDKVVYDPVSKTWYSFLGTLPVTVPAGFNPVGNANWKPQTDPDLRDELAETSSGALGAGLVAFSSSNDYPDETVGAEIGPYMATDATRKLGRKDRAAQRLSTADFIESDTAGDNDTGAAANAALAVLATKTSASLSDVHNGTVRIPQGGHLSKTAIKLDVAYPQATGGITVEGEGITSTILDMRGSAAGTNGVEATAGGGTLYPNLRNHAVFYAPGSAFKLNTATRGIFESLQGVLSGSDNIYFGNVFMSHMRQLHAISGSSHGINFAKGTTFGPTTDVYTKTSIMAHTMYARNNAGFGIGYGDIYYSHSSANGSDGNGQQGYRYHGRIRSFASTADGSESNQGPGVAVIPDGSRESIKTLSFRNLYAYGNNRVNNGSPNLLLVQPSNGAEAWVSLEGGTSVPAGAGNSSKDVIVIGPGAHLYLKGDCDLPNGFESRIGGYIHFEQVPIVTNKTVPLSTGTAICALQSTQGKSLRFAGKLNVVVRSNHPSSDVSGNLSIYELLVQKSDSGASAVKVIAQAGYADLTPGSGAISWPVFTWSLDIATNNLVATPVANVGGVEFWFEIVASGQIVASTI